MSITGNKDLTISVKNDKNVDIVVIKTNTTGTEIAGAKFTLSKNNEIFNDLRVVRKGGSWDREEDRIAVNGGVFEIPVGGVAILGLGAGDYTLTETEAPEGYIKTLQPVTFSADRNGTVTYTNTYHNTEPYVKAEDDNKQYTIQNELGAILPNAGGPGTWIYRLIGVFLILTAAGWWIQKRGRTI